MIIMKIITNQINVRNIWTRVVSGFAPGKKILRTNKYVSQNVQNGYNGTVVQHKNIK